MNYFNQPCPVCGQIFKDGDDIVVCPECATPHHRECWLNNGQCINDALHGTDFVWSASGRKSAEPENRTPPPAEENNAESENVRICHICSSENPGDALHCGNCGALFDEKKKEETKVCNGCGAEIPSQSIVCPSCGTPCVSDNQMPFNAMFGVDESEQIDGCTAGDYALYTRLNAKRYLYKFRNISSGKNTFNWAAFILGPSWFLFRKIYKVGIILLLVFVSITMMTSPLQNQITEATSKFYSASQPLVENPEAMEAASDEEVMKLINDYYASIRKPVLIIAGITLLEHLICGFTADKLYFKKVKDDLALIGKTAANNEIRKMMIMQRGSISFIAFIVGNFGSQALLDLFIALADKISPLL